MILRPPKLFNEKNPLFDWLNYVVRWVMSERVIIAGWDYRQTQNGRIYLPPQVFNQVSAGYRGEYSASNTYNAGETFSVATDTTISGIAVSAGLYGVPPAGTDAIGTWAGGVPASPTGNAVPQTPLPTIGAAPNDKFYARCLVRYCPP